MFHPSPRRGALLAAAILFGLTWTPAVAADAGQIERRCDWFENPTPGNATLADREGRWEIATQGGQRAEGDRPDFSDAPWVETNAHHG